MCGCCSLPASEASVTKSLRYSLPRSGSLNSEVETSFTATLRLAKVSLQRETSEVAPEPRWRSTGYFPICCSLSGSFRGAMLRTVLAHRGRTARLRRGTRARARDGGSHLRRRRAADVVAAGNRTLERGGVVDVGGDGEGKALQRLQRQFGNVATGGLGRAHGARHRLMRIAERHALAYQVVRKVSRGRMTLQRCRAHRLGLRLQAGSERGERIERVLERVHRIEERLLVLLVVLVVRERLALHEHEQRKQVSEDAAALAAHQLGHIRVLLLRH